MKVMLRRAATGNLVAYVAKKDLEEEVVNETVTDAGKVLTLANGWELEFSNLGEPLTLPQTYEARRLQ
ncbi:MAG TPA: putative nitrogen fixation protein NifT [Cyanobacteria bacterium UBA11162]|nr:putative nitrogen fixation protein NifT [Cyanobacteria bacterium UBA12227]HAX88574.1 putative nitrogen fixation protein NifT [Cyanobacteria bacterium UBA11370]HBL10799.1 putative nitrogen fixation protein NifT [Cyanobacteria bacterium UBA11162]HBY81082.1 putative nitrogen fixation protein NifT [Cyanobacteria bacterium UBA11148]